MRQQASAGHKRGEDDARALCPRRARRRAEGEGWAWLGCVWSGEGVELALYRRDSRDGARRRMDACIFIDFTRLSLSYERRALLRIIPRLQPRQSIPQPPTFILHLHLLQQKAERVNTGPPPPPRSPHTLPHHSHNANHSHLL